MYVYVYAYIYMYIYIYVYQLFSCEYAKFSEHLFYGTPPRLLLMFLGVFREDRENISLMLSLYCKNI